MPATMRHRLRARALPAGIVLAAALAMAPLAHAASADDVVRPIDPDRPDLTNGTATVGRGVLQIETGVEYSRTSVGGAPTEQRFSVPLVLRFGVLDRLEVRVESEPLVRLRGAEDDTGFGDLKLGLKWGFFDVEEGDWRPALGLLPFVKLPTADAPIGSERPDFGLLLLISYNMPFDFSLDVNIGGAAIGQSHPSGYLAQGQLSGSLQRAVLTERLVGFVELFYFSRDDRDGHHRFGGDMGVIYRLTPDLAVDTALETTLTGRGPDFAVRAGLSTRFGGKTR
jgi:Putative MetA-pathway of phenol degradation